MNRLTRIIVATIVGYGLSRVMPAKSAQVKADAKSPVLHSIVVGVIDAPTFKWSKSNAPYLDSMRTRFDLDNVTANAKNDYERVRALTHWTRTRLARNTSSEARRTDAVAMLQEAATAQPSRCDEYAEALSGALNAEGLPARVVNLKTADSETRQVGGAHVVAEAYLRDAQRWVMLDGQWDMIPWVKGKPASALDLKKAIDAKSAAISYVSMSGAKPADYSRWIAPYLYYMDTKLDQRVGVASDVRVLMLVPEGAHVPHVFQRTHPLHNMIYTSASQVFYPKMLSDVKPVALRSPATSVLPAERVSAAARAPLHTDG